METGPGGERHSDDELATALEEEVARITMAIPVVAVEPSPVPAAEPVPSQPERSQSESSQSEPVPEDEEWVGPPTQAISFEDLPVRRRMEGPQPTFSAWVGAAAPQPPAPQTSASPPVVPQPPASEPPASQPPAPARVPVAPAPTRAEPLSYVVPELAPRDLSLIHI